MQKLLVPVLVLATVALSSSNVLPMLSMNGLNEEPLGFSYQDTDNTYSDKHQASNKLNAILFNIGVEPEIEKISQDNYLDNDADFNSINKNDNYNVKGFRKDQWHNYPRQLDRLNRYFYEHQGIDKRNLDPDDPGNVYADESVDRFERSLEIAPNEFHLENEPEPRRINDEADIAAAVINPLLIFRIQLACYNKDLAVNKPRQLEAADIDDRQETIKEENGLSDEINPDSNLIKVKREGMMNLEGVETTQKSPKNRTVSKRLFTLLTRLKSFRPKPGHLHHRRHRLYALYGPPDSNGGDGGLLTAETRGTFMRPPGSPLRWG